MLSKEEKTELKKLSKSPTLKADLRLLAATRHNPFVVNGQVDLDRFLIFLTDYNRFINHNPRPFRKIIDKDMRL